MTDHFRALHDSLLLMPNPWDLGSARLLEALGFAALATTSSGFAATLGRRDYGVTRAEALAHAAAIVSAVDVPVSADLENGFDDVGATVRGAVEAGLAGCSIEDYENGEPYPFDVAVARVEEAVAAADGRLVLTARAEAHLYGEADLGETIERLQAFAAAGADVLYAPGLRDPDDIGSLVTAVDRPVNVLALPGGPTVPELAELGVRRVSVGGAFAFAALGAVVEAAEELQGPGTLGFWERAAVGAKAAKRAFT